MPELVELYVSNNKITTLDVSKNLALKTLQLSNNSVSNLDLKNNLQLVTLTVDGNRLEGLDLTGHERLTYLNVGGNRWDACTLNDLYYSLSRYPNFRVGRRHVVTHFSFMVRKQESIMMPSMLSLLLLS